jgi:hypothetical protein
MYFVAVVLPNVQGFISSSLVVLGTCLLAVGLYRFHQKAAKAVYNYISLDTISTSIET